MLANHIFCLKRAHAFIYITTTSSITQFIIPIAYTQSQLKYAFDDTSDMQTVCNLHSTNISINMHGSIDNLRILQIKCHKLSSSLLYSATHMTHGENIHASLYSQIVLTIQSYTQHFFVAQKVTPKACNMPCCQKVTTPVSCLCTNHGKKRIISTMQAREY
jgi:hypothetical protein